MSKTKVLRNKHVDQRKVIVKESVIEEIHTLFRQKISLDETDVECEVKRWIQAEWKSFRELKVVLKSKLHLSLEGNLYNQYLLSAMTYARDT